MLAFVRRMPPKLIAAMFYYGLPVILLLRFLLSTIWGVLLLSISVYWLAWITGEPRPFTLQKLVLWLDGLPTEAKTSVVTTMLTIFGFLVAFQTGMLNWKAQALAQMKQHVANEIDSFYTEASRLTIAAKIYVDLLVKAVNCLQSQGPSNDAIFNVSQALKKADQFRATRDRLSEMSIEVHRIAGRHSSLLATIGGALDTLEECASAFSEITQKMWVHVPIISDDNPDPLAEFAAQVNVAKCTDFLECFDRNHLFMIGNSGGVRGALLAPVVGFNLATRMSFSGRKTIFTEAMHKARKRT